ncbi:MAG: DUF2079 domain-containing protein [Actinobacteria bacterium]|nr:DUF2079 domain-containing protein [Actinomycetota bacterium]
MNSRIRRVTPWGWATAALAGAWCAWICWQLLRMHFGLGTYSYDVGLYDQGLWLLSRFEEPFVTLMGRNLFGDHTSLILLPLVPLYWVAPGTGTLLVVQSMVVAAGSAPVYLFARRVLGSGALAFGIVFAWLAHPAVTGAALENFHPDTFHALAVPLAIWAASERRWRAYAVGITMALLIKEDAFLVVVPIGIWVASAIDKRKGLVTMLAGLVAPIVAMYAVMQPLTGVPTRNSWRIPFGGVGGFVRTMFTDPVAVADHLLDADRMLYLWQMASPLLGVFLFSAGLAAVAVPVIALNVVSTYWYQHNVDYHYSIVVVPILVMAVAAGAARFDSRRRGTMVTLVAAASMAASVAWSPHSLGVSPTMVTPPDNAVVVAGRAILREVPAGAVVSLYDPLVPHAAHRREVYFFPNPFRAHLYGVDGSLDGSRLGAADHVSHVLLPKAMSPDLTALWELERPDFERNIENEFWILWGRRGSTGGVGQTPVDPVESVD